MKNSLVFEDNSSNTGDRFYNHSDNCCTTFSLWCVFCTKLPKEKGCILKIAVVIQTTVILTDDNQSNSAVK